MRRREWRVINEGCREGNVECKGKEKGKKSWELKSYIVNSKEREKRV